MEIIGLRDLADMAGLDPEASSDRNRLIGWLARNGVPYVTIGREGRGRRKGVLVHHAALRDVIERRFQQRLERRALKAVGEKPPTTAPAKAAQKPRKPRKPAKAGQ